MMMNFLFNEQCAIENMIKMNFVDNDNIFSTIKDLARYNYFIKKMNDDDNYNSVLQYLQKNGQNINEENVYSIIDACVKKAKKYRFKQVNEILITKSELQFIRNLNDIKQEKVAFILLAIAKYYNALQESQNNTAYIRNSDICKLARVTIPAKDRDVFMQFAYDKGVLRRHNIAASTKKIVEFVSNNDDNAVVLRLKENDFKDIAYTYLAYKTPHLFRRCVACGGWMKKDSKDRRICKSCFDKDVIKNSNIKTIQCIDCGKSVYVDKFNSKTCRCDVCQNIATKGSWKEASKKYRNSNKSS